MCDKLSAEQKEFVPSINIVYDFSQARAFIIIFCCCFCFFSACSSEINRDVQRKAPAPIDFDILIFTQRWPITDCMTWMNKGNDHICILPSQKDTWIIHGIWPNKFGKFGPFFCNSSAEFDVNQLQPIMDEMRQYWLNIEKGKPIKFELLSNINVNFKTGTPEESLWKHEWLKHGTCAAALQELNTENRYFGQGLAWLQQYTMNGLLAKSNILPGAMYNVTDFYNAIKQTLNINPSIHCVHEHGGGQYLSELKICFSKQLELIDCNGVSDEYVTEHTNGVITNCNTKQEIEYPSTLPEYLLNTDRESKKSVWRFPWVNLYKLIQMIKWFTL